MAKKTKGDKDIMVQFAAWLFVNQTRDAKEIAKILKVGERTIHRYSETNTWNNVLQDLRYNGVRSFRVKKAGRWREINRKIFMAKSFLDSATFHEKTLNIVPSDVVDSPEDAQSKLSDIVYRRKLVVHFLYAVVIEISIKVIWEIENGTIPEYNHDIFSRYEELSPESKKKISGLYKTQVSHTTKLISLCNGQRDSVGAVVNISQDLQSLEDALKANEQTVKNFKYDGRFKGKSSALCSLLWDAGLVYTLPKSVSNAVIFPKELLEYAIFLHSNHGYSEKV